MEKFDLRRTYLPLCGPSLPLSLHLRVPTKLKFEEGRNSFIDLVTANSKRWKTVLVYISTQHFGVEFLTKTLQSFTSLSELKFSLPNSTPPHSWNPNLSPFTGRVGNPITIASILHLSLAFETFHNLYTCEVPLLDHLTLPSLSEFTLLNDDLYCKDRDNIWWYFTRLLERSNPPLRCIYTSMDSSPENEDLILPILRLTPLLEKADGFYLGVDTLSAFVSSSASTTLPKIVPNLTELFIYDCPVDVESVNMLSSRWLGGEGPLKRVVVFDPKPRSRCRALVDKARAKLTGLEVVEAKWT